MNSFANIQAAFLQAGPVTEDRRFLFADEKINTVIVIVLVVLVGIAAYMILTGLKVRRLEQEVKEMGSGRDHQAASDPEISTIEVKKRS